MYIMCALKEHRVSMYFTKPCIPHGYRPNTHRCHCMNSFGRKFVDGSKFSERTWSVVYVSAPGDDIFLSFNSGFKMNSDSAGDGRVQKQILERLWVCSFWEHLWRW